ncbi:unnamed protein product, partial [Heterosigma akashiwo]
MVQKERLQQLSLYAFLSCRHLPHSSITPQSTANETAKICPHDFIIHMILFQAGTERVPPTLLPPSPFFNTALRSSHSQPPGPPRAQPPPPSCCAAQGQGGVCVCVRGQRPSSSGPPSP